VERRSDMTKAIGTGFLALGLTLAVLMGGCGEPGGFGCTDAPFEPHEMVALTLSPSTVASGEPATFVASFDRRVFSHGAFLVEDWEIRAVDPATGEWIGSFSQSRYSESRGEGPYVSGVVLDAEVIDERSMEVSLDALGDQAPSVVLVEMRATNGDPHCSGLVSGEAELTVADESDIAPEVPSEDMNEYAGGYDWDAPVLLDAKVSVDGANLVESFDPEQRVSDVEIPSDATEITVELDVDGPVAEVNVHFNGIHVISTGEPITLPYPDPDGRPHQSESVRIDLTADDGSVSHYTIAVLRFPPEEPPCPVAVDWRPLLKYASKRSPGDRFGHDVAVDCHTLAVSANKEDSCSGTDQTNNSCADAGAVYVAHSLGGQARQYLKAANPDAGDQFGYSIALDGDLLAVGAPFEDGNGASNVNEYNDREENAGAVYLFRRHEDEWVQVAYLKSTGILGGDFFGYSVAVSGNRVAVGARNARYGAGVVYIFEYVGGRWQQTAWLSASNSNSGDRFGTAIDFDWPLLIVGAPHEKSDATGVNGDEDSNYYPVFGAGAAYIFEDVGTDWVQRAYLKQSNTNDADDFGRSVAIDGTTAVVGAWAEDSRYPNGTSTGEADNSASSAGAAYVFELDRWWRQTAYLKASNADEGDRFGSSVDIDGDVIVVGAPNEDASYKDGGNDMVDVGAVYPYRRSGGTWAHAGYLKMTGAEGGELFGSSVAVSVGVIAVGAPDDSFVNAHTGTAWVFE